MEGDLARLPWAALPGCQPGTVLLEEYLLATVPHGPFLLERLLETNTTEDPGRLLAVGDVAYDAPGRQARAAPIRPWKERLPRSNRSWP